MHIFMAVHKFWLEAPIPKNTPLPTERAPALKAKAICNDPHPKYTVNPTWK